ncbi:MAG TPA: hypothetical protein VGO93_15440 [Candidatus Xenobia bacterium]|jgi:hypothetical protein
MIHVRFNGRSYDLDERELSLRGGVSDAELKRSVARFLEVASEKFRFHVVDRRPSGDVIVRPEAVYG